MIEDWEHLPKYSVLPDRPQITHHKQLPNGVRLVGQSQTGPHISDPFLFYENNGGLSIVTIDENPLFTGSTGYECYQYDFPMKFLIWFPQTLTAYRLPPGQSPYQGMTTPDMDVGGEMLSLGRGMAIGGDGVPGYSVDNWSRHWEPNYQAGEAFTPISISWTEIALFDYGILALIEDLGKKWQKGIL